MRACAAKILWVGFVLARNSTSQIPDGMSFSSGGDITGYYVAVGPIATNPFFNELPSTYGLLVGVKTSNPNTVIFFIEATIQTSDGIARQYTTAIAPNPVVGAYSTGWIS